MDGTDQPRQGSRPLTTAETRAIVARNFWGVLSTVGDGQPYAVPIIYGYDGAFYAVVRDGRKLRNLDENPRACLNVVETTAMAKTWRSALALGRVEWLVDDGAVASALEVIRDQYPGQPTRSGASVAALRAQGFRVMKLVVDELTGRGSG